MNEATEVLNFNKSVFIITGLDCGDCAAKLEKQISNLAGVKTASLNFGAGKLTVEHSNVEKDILKAIQEAGYEGQQEGQKKSTLDTAPKWYQNKRLLGTILSGILLTILTLAELIGIEENSLLPFYILTLIIGGFHTARSGLYSIKNLTFDMNFLMSTAIIGAAAIGQWAEAATVVFLFSLGNTLQSYTLDKTRQSIKSLMELAPPEALVRRNGTDALLAVSEIVIDDLVIVKPGEKIPMDGIVIRGASSVNQSAITGESLPVNKSEGDRVFAGTVNEYGSLEISVTKLSNDSTLAKIMHLVEEAQGQKAPSQQFVDQFTKYYTPAVMALALGIAVIPAFVFGQAFDVWFYRALVLLVISCPCALVISTPVSIVSAIGNASRQGVLIKGGAYLEKLGMIRAIAFDKTGTLTKGRPTVTDVLALSNHDESKILALASALEHYSEHPIAQAIIEKAGTLATPQAKNFKALVGKGIEAEVDGQSMYLGNFRLFTELGHSLANVESKICSLENQGKTVMLLGNKEMILGAIAVADSLRDDSISTIKMLRKLGIESLTMVTGDNEGSAKSIANELNLTAYHSELLPQDKVEAIQKIGQEYGSILMVGDGVNDAPALAVADVGVAMGAAGTDAALETADIALMADDLSKLSYVIQLSRKTVSIIKQNVFFSLFIKLFVLVLAFFGMANLWLAVFADTGASILVTLNGLRLVKKLV